MRARSFSLFAPAFGLLLVSCQSTELLAIIETSSGAQPSVPTTGPATDAGSVAFRDAAVVPTDAAAPPALQDGGLADAGPADSPVTAINDPSAIDTDPSFTGDLLELYFMSTRDGSKDLFRSVRDDPGQPWRPPEPLTELSAPGQEENPFVSADGLDLWFFTDRDRTLGSIWHSTRAVRGEQWSSPEPVTGLSLAEGGSDVAVTVDPTRTRFILNSKLPGAPPYGMHEFLLDATTETFGPPVTLMEINSELDDFDPDLREDGLFIAFDSPRLGTRQIFWSRRTALDQPFTTPVPLSAETPETDESAVAFSEDLRYLMFSSIRSGNAEIYERTLAAPP